MFPVSQMLSATFLPKMLGLRPALSLRFANSLRDVRQCEGFSPSGIGQGSFKRTFFTED
jgi:hypothetical protein